MRKRALLPLLLILAGGSAAAASPPLPVPAPTPAPAVGGGAVGMANPASVNCERLGGRLEFRAETGGTAGYCHLPDGRVVEEWQLFRQAPPPQ